MSKGHYASSINKFDYKGRTSNKFLGFVIILAAIVVSLVTSSYIWVWKRAFFERLTYCPIDEAVALGKAFDLKTVLPTELNVISGSDKAKVSIPAKTTVKVLGAYMSNLHHRPDSFYNLSPKGYSPDQYYLVQLADGTRGSAQLPEMLLGQRVVIRKGDHTGDTLTVSGVKINSTNDKFPYDFSVKGSQQTYRWSDFTCLNEKSETVVYSYPLGRLPVDQWKKAARVPSFMRIPTHDSNGFFLFPRYKKWNMYMLRPWARSGFMLNVYWILILLVVLWRLSAYSINISVKADHMFRDNPSLSNRQVYDKTVQYYFKKYYPRAFLVGCVFSPLVWLLTRINRSAMMSGLTKELDSERCSKCGKLGIEWKYTGNVTAERYLGTFSSEGGTYEQTVYDYGGEKVWDPEKEEFRYRKKTISTTFAPGSYEVYESEKEWMVYCTKCGAVFQKGWEKNKRTANRKGGELLRERTTMEPVTYGYIKKK